ncbi:MAG: tetratricopeptide repeat protein [Gemmatimonadota bacterium]
MSERDVGILRSLARRIDPEDAGAHNNLGVVLFQKGLREDALDAFERALTLDPHLEVAHRNVRIALRESGELARRLQALRGTLERTPEDAAARDALARTLFLGGDPDAAAREWRALLAATPRSAELHVKLADAEAERGDVLAAIGMVERAAALAPEDPEVRLRLGELRLRADQPNAAEREVRRVLSARPDHGRAHLFLAELLEGTDRQEEAEAEWRWVEERAPDLVRARGHLSLDRYRAASAARVDRLGPDIQPVDGALGHVARANALRRAGDLEGAAAELERGIEAGDDPPEARQHLAEVRLLQGRPGDAAGLYESLLARQGDSPKLWNERGVALHRLGRIEAAVMDYRRTVALDHGYVLGWSNLGVALAQRGDAAQAERALRTAVNGDAPPEVLWNLGLFLLQRDRVDEATEVFRAAVERDGAVARSWSRLGLSLFQAGRLTEARDALLQALEHEPELAEARYQLGFVLSALGDFNGALRETQRALEQEPVLPVARYLLLIDVQFEDSGLPAPEPERPERVLPGSAVKEFEFEPGELDRAFGRLEPEPRAPAPGERGATTRAALAEASRALEQGRLSRAADAASRAVALAPDDPGPRLVHGRVLLRQGLAGEAIERFDAVIASRSATLRAAGLEGRVRALLELGRAADAVKAARELEAAGGPRALRARALLQAGRVADAAAAYRDAVTAGETDAETLTGYGTALLELRRPDEAEPVFRRALEAAPGGAARVGLARSLEAVGDQARALSAYREALEALPSYAPAALGLAELAWRSGRRQEALRTLVAFLELDPTDVDALVRLGAWLGELGRQEQAERALERALTLDPEHAGALREIERIWQGEGR